MTFEGLPIRGPPILYRNNLVQVEVHMHNFGVTGTVTDTSFPALPTPTLVERSDIVEYFER